MKKERTTVEKVSAGVALGLALVGILYILMLVAEVGFGWVLFSSTFSAIVNTGGISNLYFAKAVAMMCTVIWYVSMPVVMISFLWFRRMKASMVLGSLYLGWYLLLFGLTYGSGNLVFNPLGGGANYSYYEAPGGAIELYPLEFTVHPILGVPLKPVTSEVMQKYVKQHPELNNKFVNMGVNGLLQGEKTGKWVGGDVYKFYKLKMEFADVHGTDKGTQITWKVSGYDGFTAPFVMSADYFNGSYLVDIQGQRHKILAIAGDFDPDRTRSLAAGEIMVVIVTYDYQWNMEEKNVFFSNGMYARIFFHIPEKKS